MARNVDICGTKKEVEEGEGGGRKESAVKS